MIWYYIKGAPNEVWAAYSDEPKDAFSWMNEGLMPAYSWLNDDGDMLLGFIERQDNKLWGCFAPEHIFDIPGGKKKAMQALERYIKNTT